MHYYGRLQSDKCPGPEARVRLQSPVDQSVFEEAIAIIDTGATRTCVSRTVFERLKRLTTLDAVGDVKVKGATGPGKKTVQYMINIEIGEHRFRDVKVVELDRNIVVIGRDILNQFKVTFDGPGLAWEIHDSSNE